jgi:uncharacterized oligopeptide transporter (OPT) family protein
MSMSMLAATTHDLATGVCPAAPPGVQQYADEITSWVKWGVLVLIVIAVFVSIGMLVAGRIMHNPQSARAGAAGLIISIIAAILYVTVYAIVTGIVGSGC